MKTESSSARIEKVQSRTHGSPDLHLQPKSGFQFHRYHVYRLSSPARRRLTRASQARRAGKRTKRFKLSVSQIGRFLTGRPIRQHL